jgi:1-deoxy-D-xylulose-5-phosphate synthase
MAPIYRSAKERLEKVLDRMPSLGPQAVEMLRRLKGGLKHLLFPEAWFESLGFSYYGPIDGHDIEGMQRVLRDAKALKEPVIVHVVTKKGKGYEPAEKDPERYHGPGPFDPATGEIYRKDGPPAWNKVFGEAMCAFAKTNPRLVAITAAMSDGTGLGEFKELFPDRFFDVGIAESHAVTYAAGLAQGGMLPVVAIYSTFLQRSYDQIVQDVSQQRLKVVFAIDRAGLVGDDGETHHGEFDLSYLRTVPGMVVMAPKDEIELVNMLHTAFQIPESCAVRYPRGAAIGADYREALEKPELLETGKAEVLQSGSDVTVMAVGSAVYPALQAAEILSGEGVSCAVVNARFVKPFDRELVARLVKTGPLLVVEENVPAGGLGEAVLSFAAGTGEHREVATLSLPDAFVQHGPQSELRKLSGLDAESIAERVRRLVKEAYDR